MTSPFQETLEFVKELMHYEEIRGGTMKSEGICDYKGQPLLLNFWNVPEPAAYAGMLLFSTGPYDLNIAMRARAKGKGLTLSQYGLFDTRSGNQLDEGKEEAEIFDTLGYEYLTPVERETWRGKLTLTKPKKYTVNVHSSDNVNVYQVVIEDGVATECECKGWTYRHNCRHLVEAEEIWKQRQ